MTIRPRPRPPKNGLRLNQSDATLMLAALEDAISYVREERRPEDRRASEARAARFSELRARLLEDVARLEISESPESEPDRAEAACA